MKLRKIKFSRAGLTIVELAVALMMSVLLASALLAVVSQQVTFTRILNQQSFLRDEAPQINLLLSNILASASSYRIYASKSDAFTESAAVNSGGAAVRLIFRQPDGTEKESVITFETLSGETGLNYYVKGSNWGANPNWTITSRPVAVDFSNDSGLLLVGITGPNAEEITYVGK